MIDPTQRRAPTRAEYGALIAAAIGFLLLAGYRIAAPGLYGDELLFAPPALQALGQCEIQSYVSLHWGHCFPIYLDPPYLGALKAWLYAPIFALFDPSPQSIRWPAIVLSLGALGLLFDLLRRERGTSFAVAAAVVFALDPVLVFHSRFDWAPFVLCNLCKLGVLAALWAWLRSGKPAHLAIAMSLALVGLFDKLNFLWIVVALGGAAFAAYPRAIVRHLRSAWYPHLGLALAFAAVLAAVLWYRVLPAMRMDILYLPQHLDLRAQWPHLVLAYNETFATTFAHNWMFAQQVPSPAWPILLLLGQGVATLIFALLRPWRRAALVDSWRSLLFVSVAIVLLLLQMLLTRQLGAAQHLSMLWPLPTLQLLLLVDSVAAYLRTNRNVGAPLGATAISPAAGPQASRALRVAPVAALAAALVVASLPRHQDLLAGWRGEHEFRGRFDPRIVDLAATLATTKADTIIAIDWGLVLQLATLAPADQRARFHEWWPHFFKPWTADPATAHWLYEHEVKGRDSVWLSFAPGQDVFPETRRNAPGFFAEWGGCLRLERTLPGSTGAPLYQIWRYRTDVSCPLPDFQPSDAKATL